MWTLSTGEAEPPQANRMLVTKALPHEVALLAFVPLNRSLRGLDFLAYPAGVATFHSNQ
jgi:hypothetical protein